MKRFFRVAALAATPLLLALSPLAAELPAAASTIDVPAAAPVRWEIDAAHSEVGFRIRHLVSRVRGNFTDWSGTITADPQNLSNGSVEVTIRTASINTNQQRRDEHLRSADFFDAENHPTITFKSSRVEAKGKDIKVYGNLTMRGVTRPVVLEGSMLEVGGVPGKRRIGFEAGTKVNRLDYGVSWNRAAEGGGAVLGDEVEINIAIEAVEKA